MSAQPPTDTSGIAMLLQLVLGQLPGNVQTIVADAVADAPEALALLADVRAGVATLQAIPRDQRKAVDFARAFGITEGSAFWHTARLIDLIEAQVPKPKAGP